MLQPTAYTASAFAALLTKAVQENSQLFSKLSNIPHTACQTAIISFVHPCDLVIMGPNAQQKNFAEENFYRTITHFLTQHPLAKEIIIFALSSGDVGYPDNVKNNLELTYDSYSFFFPKIIDLQNKFLHDEGRMLLLCKCLLQNRIVSIR